MTNTTDSVNSQHLHSFNAQGVCSCGLTHDEYRQAEEAKNAPAPETPATPTE
jgi:hypothetical protein